MEKRLITNAILEVLLNSNLIFDEKTFKNMLTSTLSKQNFELHEKTVQKILKNLQTKDYIDTDENFFIKSNKTLLHKGNKQKELFQYLVEQYKDEFDNDFIKDEYLKSIKSTEQPPVEHLEVLEDSFKLYAEHFNLNKKTEHTFRN